MKKVQELLFLNELQKFITASRSGRRLGIKGERITSGTIRMYDCVHSLISAFQQQNEIVLKVPLCTSNSVLQRRQLARYWKQFFTNFTSFLHKRKLYDQYINTVLKIIGAFLNYLSKDRSFSLGFIKQVKLPDEVSVPVVLQPAQLKFLIADTEFNGSLPLHLRRTKDIFVFGCTVGLRISDLMLLRKRDIHYDGVNTYLTCRSKKSSTPVKIPIPDYLIKIIQKYKLYKGPRLLPQLSITNLNKQIKCLIEKAGWTYPLPKFRHRQGKPVELKLFNGKPYRFCDHMTTHTMRRTAITTLLMMGVPEMVVRKISGHAAGSKEFFKYVTLSQEYLNTTVQKAHEMLSN